jgi:hypothetical protein
MVSGSTSTVTFVTVACGAATTGIAARFPAVLVTLEETQQFRLVLSGSTMYHQPASAVFPTIWELVPMFNALRTIHATLGPRRQLTATSLGNATGTVGVDVVVGGGVFEGTGVWVGALVGKACVTEGVTTVVGVSVWGVFDGKLQADMAKIRVNTNNKFRNFIKLSFCWLPIILCRNLADGNSSSDSDKKSLT